MTDRTGARILVDQLHIQGVNHIFCVPGESYLPVLDALLDSPIRVVTNRHESGSTFMAEAYAKLTGQPGVAIVSRGPGATNAAIGIHTAFQDSTPLVLLIGQVGSEYLDREAFQEIDYRRMFGPMAKWVAQVDRADRLPEYIARAFQTATSGRHGPVVLALPEDMLKAHADVMDAQCHQPVHTSPSDLQLAAFRRELGKAERPVVIVGGTGWTQAACDNLRRFAQANQLPVACAFRHQDLFDNRNAHYIGDVGLGINPRLAQRIKDADLLIVLGARLGEVVTSRYSLIDIPRPKQALVHVHPSVEELGRVFQPSLAIAAGMNQFTSRLAMMMPIENPPWREHLSAARADCEAWQARPPVYSHTIPKLDLWQVLEQLRAGLPENTLLANGAGNFAIWAHRFWRYTELHTQLAPVSGAMGYGLPAGIAAKMVAPERTVVIFSGDGDFLMTSQELATAVQNRIGVIVIVFNNGMYGTIRMHQERSFPGRVSATGLVNPHFGLLAQSYGAFGVVVETTDTFASALAQAIAHTRDKRTPALIELRCDPEVITPNATLAAMRATAKLG
ncbi:MAG TPA: thiamine pyrophosphate-binding protein [Burkholderiaceae bacterium]|nr:thiamine pyrophosphate-binding protein [Burkholderiaceae bacterium]